MSQDWIWATAAHEAGGEPGGRESGNKMSVQKSLKGQKDSKMALKGSDSLSTGK